MTNNSGKNPGKVFGPEIANRLQSELKTAINVVNLVFVHAGIAPHMNQHSFFASANATRRRDTGNSDTGDIMAAALANVMALTTKERFGGG